MKTVATAASLIFFGQSSRSRKTPAMPMPMSQPSFEPLQKNAAPPRKMASAIVARRMKGLKFFVAPNASASDAGHSNNICLLYTSDAADDLLCVDLGGR